MKMNIIFKKTNFVYLKKDVSLVNSTLLKANSVVK